ncbi:MAG: trypsin-like peptidase domain-containing protein [Deltaproteobacteria bacterium]|nr:trypsin-like peptidase domain-containing protein [Deltaproteobacteria bacterium]
MRVGADVRRPAAGGDAYEPTGQATTNAKGLGPNAPRKIWTDGNAALVSEPIAVRSDTFVRLANEANPAIVNIFTAQDLRVGIGDPLGIFSLPVDQGGIEVNSLGTGFFISPDGFLLTNAHVVAKADRVHVFMHDRSEAHEVQVIGIDQLTDLALLRVETTEPTPYLKLADSDAVEIGQVVVAIGNPFGLDYSLTTGVISAKNRVISPGSRRGLYEDFLQTSAQINPGNSGGPLLDLWGEVVGINSAVVKGGQGIGFALPSNMVKELLPNIARNGRVRRGYAGIGLAELNPALARRFRVEGNNGALVVTVDPNGPAGRAGLARGDVILSINGDTVADSARGVAQDRDDGVEFRHRAAHLAPRAAADGDVSDGSEVVGIGFQPWLPLFTGPAATDMFQVSGGRYRHDSAIR